MRILDKRESITDILIWIFISIYICIFSYLCFIKFQSFNYYDWDFASDITVLWNSLHGKFLYYPFLEEIIFGAHLYLIILLILPIYAIFQHPFTLLSLQTVFLALAAYPLYRLACLKLDKPFALLISISYLLYPSLGFINLFETHFEIYEIFFLFFALYYFEKEDFKKFLIFIFLAISCKENVSLVIFMFGIYAILRKRPRKWILVPSLLGLIWFFLAVKVIIPYFNKDAELYSEGFMFTVYYRHLGNNISEMIKTLITKPIWVFRNVFTERKSLYLFQLFAPTAFLGFLSPSGLLMTLPVFIQNLISIAVSHTKIYYQYNALLIPFIFYSTINGFKKLLGFKIISNRPLVVCTLFIGVSVISGIYLRGPQFYSCEFVKFYPIDELAKEKEKLIKLIPRDAPVIATFQFLPKLASRHNIYSMHFVVGGTKMYTDVQYKPPENLEYTLIDFNEPLMINYFFMAGAADNIRSFIENGNWDVFKATDDIVLFKRGTVEKEPLFGPAFKTNIQKAINANIDNQIMFLGYDTVSYNEKDRILRLSYYWKALEKPDKPLGMHIYFLDSKNKIRFQKFHNIGYRIYGLNNYPKDKIIKENHYIFIPSSVEKGIYRIRLSMYSLEDGGVLSISPNAKLDEFNRIMLGNISIN